MARLSYKRIEEIDGIVFNIYQTVCIREFPLNITKIFDVYGINVYKYSECDYALCKKYSNDAFSFGSKIFYDDSMYYKRIRFSLAHELGHIILGHTRLEENKAIEEAEADTFAASLLIPMAAIMEFSYPNVSDISDHFDVSSEAANIAYSEFMWRKSYLNNSYFYRKMHDYLFKRDRIFITRERITNINDMDLTNEIYLYE